MFIISNRAGITWYEPPPVETITDEAEVRTLPHLSASCHVTHKASTLSRRAALPAAAMRTSIQFFPSSSFSFSLCRPSPCFLRSAPRPLSSSRLGMNFHLLLRTSSLRFSISAICRTSLFVILSCQRILSIRLRHPFWKTSIFFTSLLIIFHVSQPYIKTGFTSVLYNLTLVHRLMLLLLQFVCNLNNTPLALTTLLWMSCVPPPLETEIPRYTNRSTSSIPCLFTSTVSLLREFISSSLQLSILTFSPTLSAS